MTTAVGSEPVKLADLDGRATITVPEAGKLFGLGRAAAYNAVNRGDIPSIRIGRRVVVPVPALLNMLRGVKCDG